jgi:hypothetical protein
MIDRIKHGVIWISAIRDLSRGNNGKFLRKISTLPGTVELSLYQRALIATSLLIEGQHDKAQAEFEKISSGRKVSNDDNEKYIKLYCSARLSGMKGDMKSVSDLSIQALNLKSKKLYRERLPME